jgi:hypothetical protein
VPLVRCGARCIDPQTDNTFYVATATLYEAPLFTADGPLARAPSLGVVIQNVRS